METKAPPSSFFEISINTEKFSQFTTSLNAILANHEKQLQQHTRQLSQIRLQTDEKVNRVRSECEYQFTKMSQKRKEESQEISTFHNDLTVKYEYLTNQYRSKLVELQGSVIDMQNKLEKQESALLGRMLGRIQEEIGALINNTKSFVDREIANMNQKVREMEQMSSSQDNLVKNIINAYQNQSQNGQMPTQRNSQSSKQYQPNMVNIHRYATPTAQKGLCLQQMTVKDGKDRKRKKVQDKCEFQNLQYASVSAKLEVLENRLTAKENESLDKIVYANKKQDNILSQPSENNFNYSLGTIEIERKNLQQKISLKLQNIENIINTNFKRMQRELSRVSQNQITMKEELQILYRKLEKDKIKFNQMSFQMKRLEEKRVDEKLIDNMATMFKRQYRSLQEELQKKMAADSFNRERQRLNERIQIIGDSVAEKANKEQIKRAFLFVEDKMKEIITIIADDIHQEKEGAGKRIPFKCLSCDKDLDSSLPNTLRNPNPDHKPLRPQSQMQIIRRKVKVHNEDKA